MSPLREERLINCAVEHRNENTFGIHKLYRISDHTLAVRMVHEVPSHGWSTNSPLVAFRSYRYGAGLLADSLGYDLKWVQRFAQQMVIAPSHGVAIDALFAQT